MTDRKVPASRARAPLQMFVKLGVRFVVVVDDRGLYLGLLEKERYLVYLQWLEKRASTATAKGFAGLSSMTGSRWRQEVQVEAEESLMGSGLVQSSPRGRSKVRHIP